MKRTFFSSAWNKKFWLIFVILINGLPIISWGQVEGEAIAEELAKEGFENIRWTETETERIYTIENSAYKIQSVGVSRAIDIIQKNIFSNDKQCKIIVTQLNIPILAVTLSPNTNNNNTNEQVYDLWKICYELEDSWNKVKKEKIKNSSLFNVDIVIYPQLSFRNLIITQIYQALFTMSPAIEISLWKGMKLTGQVIIPIYNDGYGSLQDKIHPGYLTLSQSFRLPYNILGKATFGYFNQNRYGIDLEMFHPFKDERFSFNARIGVTAIGYWNGFKLHYDRDLNIIYSLGLNYYWPQYDTQFSIKGEQYLLKEKGIKFEMIRHFKYASIGFYAEKAQYANSNGGFMFQVLLPPYNHKRSKYLPKLNTSLSTGITYNAGNEQYYYKMYKAEPSDNIIKRNEYNPFFIISKLKND